MSAQHMVGFVLDGPGGVRMVVTAVDRDAGMVTLVAQGSVSWRDGVTVPLSSPLLRDARTYDAAPELLALLRDEHRWWCQDVRTDGCPGFPGEPGPCWEHRRRALLARIDGTG